MLTADAKISEGAPGPATEPAPRESVRGRGPAVVLAIDPGHEESAWVLYDPKAGRPTLFGKEPNETLLARMNHSSLLGAAFCAYGQLVVEQIASYGMTVGAEVFETVFWSGRFCQAWEQRGGEWDRVKRLAVKMHLCHDSRAKDSNIRQALIDRYGGKDHAIGRKASKGPLYGVSADVWSALAVAVVWSDQNGGERQVCP